MPRSGFPAPRASVAAREVLGGRARSLGGGFRRTEQGRELLLEAEHVTREDLARVAGGAQMVEVGPDPAVAVAVADRVRNSRRVDRLLSLDLGVFISGVLFFGKVDPVAERGGFTAEPQRTLGRRAEKWDLPNPVRHGIC